MLALIDSDDFVLAVCTLHPTPDFISGRWVFSAPFCLSSEAASRLCKLQNLSCKLKIDEEVKTFDAYVDDFHFIAPAEDDTAFYLIKLTIDVNCVFSDRFERIAAVF